MKKIVAILSVLTVLLTSCAGNEYVATAGGEKITKSQFEFYLSSIKSQMGGSELSTDEDWNNQEIEGMPAIDFAKEQALQTSAENLAYISVGKYLGIEFDDEDKNEIKQIKDNLSTNFGGAGAYKDFLKKNNLKDDFFDMLCRSMVYSEKLLDMAISENPITDTEKQAKFEEITKEGKYKAKHILIKTIDSNNQPLADEEKEKAKSLFEDIYAKVKSGEDFDKLMFDYTQDPGTEQNPDGYVFSDGEMVPEFEDCVKSLDINGVGTAETTYGYHIILRLPVEMSDVESDIDTSIKNDRLKNKMEEWKSEIGFEVIKNDDVYNSVN